MHRAIELHDSVLASVGSRDGVVVVILRPAYVHSSEGEPGVNDGWVGVQTVILEFDDGRVDGTIEGLPADISDGDFEADGVLSPNMIKLPCDTATRAVLTLYLSPGYGKVSIQGARVRVTTESEIEYVEAFRRQ